MGEAVTEAELKRRPLKDISDCDLEDKVTARTVTIVNTLSVRSERIFINRVLKLQGRIMHCITPEGHRWINADNVIRISRNRKAVKVK